MPSSPEYTTQLDEARARQAARRGEIALHALYATQARIEFERPALLPAFDAYALMTGGAWTPVAIEEAITRGDLMAFGVYDRTGPELLGLLVCERIQRPASVVVQVTGVALPSCEQAAVGEWGEATRQLVRILIGLGAGVIEVSVSPLYARALALRPALVTAVIPIHREINREEKL